MNQTGEYDIVTMTKTPSSKGPWYLERLFINLKVISKVKSGDKLYVNYNILLIEDPERPYPVRAFSRWLYSESRDKTLNKIQSIIKDAIDCGRKAIESNDLDEDRNTYRLSKEELSRRVYVRNWEDIRDNELHMGNNALLKNLIDQLSGVTLGIKELEKTYDQDMTLCSKLELELEVIERSKAEFQNYLAKKEENKKVN